MEEYDEVIRNFAADVANMMTLRDEYLTKKAKHRARFGKVGGEDVEEAYHEYKKSECEVKGWLKDILGLDD